MIGCGFRATRVGLPQMGREVGFAPITNVMPELGETMIPEGEHESRPTGFEPATTGSTVRYSNQLSYGPSLSKKILESRRGTRYRQVGNSRGITPATHAVPQD
jgi:hypothetical protein